TSRFTLALSLSFSAYRPDLHSFPTRRSSDLALLQVILEPTPQRLVNLLRFFRQYKDGQTVVPALRLFGFVERCPWVRLPGFRQRSEEHTSELQSRENLVCRLLLEKKK